MAEILLGSLFDGIGAVPYAASFFGIKPLWASEILPNAISVTKRHFPNMQHLGDVTKLHGGKIPPVDIVAFGSPCQSWSVAAGNRKGLDGKSGLFMEAIRIIREMREATNGKSPQIALFENVTGLLNCRANGRSDYQTVLEAFCETEIPMPKSGRWANAGMVRGRGIDLAWVVKDSQYHRTAQRRKRLFVIIDFAGQRAGEILFVSKSLSGYFAARESERERTAADSESGVRSAITVINDQGGNSLSIEKEELSPTLRSQTHGNLPIVCAAFMAGQAKNARSIAYSEALSPTLKGSPSGLNQMPCICEPVVYAICSDSSNSMKSSNPHSGVYKADTSRTLDQNGGNPGCNQGGMLIVEPQMNNTQHDFSLCVNCEKCVVAIPAEAVTMRLREGCAGGGKGPLLQIEKSGTLATANDQYLFCVDKRSIDNLSAYGFDLQQITNKTNRSQLKEVQPVLCQTGRPHVVITGDENNNPQFPVYCLQGNMIGRQDKNGPQGSGINEGICFTVSPTDHHAVVAVDCRNLTESEISGTLQSKCTGGYSLNFQNPLRVGYIVRRLTPTEAERLMSLPDSWTEYGHDGKLMSDSARYQMCGNSIVVNVLAYIMQNIAEHLSATKEQQAEKEW